MTDDKTIARINSFLTKEFMNSMGDIAIFKNIDGSYELFNRYIIIEDDNQSFIVTPKFTSQVRSFSTLKNAVTWCIFDKRNKFREIIRIEELDRMIGSTEVSMTIQKRLIKKSRSIENKLIYIAKLSEEKAKKQRMVQEMASYISESRNWQTKKFTVNEQNK